MNKIITIGRQFGSEGHEIGKKIAEHYSIECYDKELIARAAKDSGFCEEMILTHDERPTSSFLYNLVMDTYGYGYSSSSFIDMPIGQKVFIAQFETIKKIANEGPSVIVGRCADYALAERTDCLHIFIYAPIEYRTKRIMERYELSEDKAKDLIVKKDRQRQNYYNYYSNKKWGKADSYDICINSSILEVDGTADSLIHFIDCCK